MMPNRELPKRSYSLEIALALNTYLTMNIGDDGYDFEKESGVITFTRRIQSKIKELKYTIIISQTDYVVYTSISVGADKDDKDSMLKMAEFICRVNKELYRGCFDFDMRDGTIRCRTYVDCDEGMPSAAVVHNSIEYPAEMFKNYSEGILAVMFGRMEPNVAMGKCRTNVKTDLVELLGGKYSNEDIDSLITMVGLNLSSGLDFDSNKKDEQ